MTTQRPFRWQPHDGKRHAVHHDTFPTQHTTTLCGEELTIPTTRATKQQWCWPTCTDCDTDCDTAWRLAEGIPLPLQQRRTANGPGPAHMLAVLSHSARG
jgi:hypothetical protein